MRHLMMTSSNGNIFRVTGHLCGEFTGPRWIPTQRPVSRSFDVFVDLRQNKRLSKQSWGWWFETLSCPLWRHCNVFWSYPWIYVHTLWLMFPNKFRPKLIYTGLFAPLTSTAINLQFLKKSIKDIIFSDPVLIYLIYMTPKFKLDNDIGISWVVIFLTSPQWNNSLHFSNFEHNVTTRQTWTWTRILEYHRDVTRV